MTDLQRQYTLEQLLLQARAWPEIMKDGHNDWAIQVDALFNPLLGGTPAIAEPPKVEALRTWYCQCGTANQAMRCSNCQRTIYRG